MTAFTDTFSNTNEVFGNTYEFRLLFGESELIGYISFPLLYQKNRFLFTPHNHSFYELQLVLGEAMNVRIANEEYLALPDSLSIIHPYEYHTYLRPKSDTYNYSIVSFSFRIRKLSNRRYQDLNLGAAVAALDHIYNIPHMRSQLMPVLDLIQEEFQGHRPGYMTIIADLLKGLFLRVLRTALPSSEDAPTEGKNWSRAIIVDQFYSRQYASQASISELAASLSLSERRTNQLIHELYGCSFSEKLMDTRIEMSKLYLSYSDYSVGQIALISGFQSSNFFYKTFRTREGLSPGEYRLQHPGRFMDSVSYKGHPLAFPPDH